MKSKPLPKAARVLLTFLCSAVLVLLLFIVLFLFAFAFDDRVNHVFCLPCFAIGIVFVNLIVFMFLFMNMKEWYIKNISNAIIGIVSFYLIMAIADGYLNFIENSKNNPIVHFS